ASPSLPHTFRARRASDPNQNKIYGDDDPALPSVLLGNVVNRANIVTWNGTVSGINDTGAVATTLASLTRDVGETVGSYNITAATFNALTGGSASNYSGPSFTGTASPPVSPPPPPPPPPPPT